MDVKHMFLTAEKHLAANEDQLALVIYRQLSKQTSYEALSLFRIAEISNRSGDALYASECFYKALKIDPQLNSIILKNDHPLHNQSYKNLTVNLKRPCPLCGDTGQPYWVYYIAVQDNCPTTMSPIKTWLHCKSCHHLFAAEIEEYPSNEALDKKTQPITIKPLTYRFPFYSQLLNTLSRYTEGNALLEVGTGHGECIAVAREMMFDVTGIDMSEICAKMVNDVFKLNIICADYITYPFKKVFDIIIMGDVIEHIIDPHAFMKKTAELCHPGTVLWVSTPNFETAFTLVAGHSDPMRREPRHYGYFSFLSLRSLLDNYGFDVLTYAVSSQFNGSMEITAIKR